jgi:hypothetical protein
MYSVQDDSELPETGCPIRKSPDQSLFSGSPKLNAANHVLHRLLAPRHPPYALSSLTTFANTTQRKLQFCYPYSVVKEQLQIRTERSNLSLTERLVNGDF